MRLRIVIAGLLFLAGIGSELRAQKDYLFTVVHPDSMRVELATDRTAILIDVRMKMEFRKRHIENAINLPKKKDLENFIATTHNFRPVYLYCTTETRARQAAKILIDNGFTNVYILEGGMNKWVSLNRPTEKGR